MKKKKLEDMSLKELEEHIAELKTKSKAVNKVEGSPYVVGENYMIRTVTMIYTGKLEAVYDNELVLSKCAWIPETERWEKTVKEGKFKEVEPYTGVSEVVIGRGAILDAFIVNFELPENQK